MMREAPTPIVVIAALAAALAGCAGGGGAADAASSGPTGTAGTGSAADTPVYRVGDRWVYHGVDGFRVKTQWEEIHEVTDVGANGVTVRVTKRGSAGDAVRTEQWTAAGRVAVGALFADETRRFAEPLERYAFPLASGRTWNQWVDQFDESAQRQGQINRYVHVGGLTRVTTSAGTFDAYELHVVMTLADQEFWRWPTRCNYVVWYAPAVRNSVREKKDAQYLERGGDVSVVPVRTQFTTLELVSFQPGGS